MTYFERINLPISSGWKSTLANAFQVLRRIAFVVPETFSFGDFDPQIDFRGMANAGLITNRARYLKIYKLLFFSLDFEATLGAPLTNYVTITLPEGLTAYGEDSFHNGSVQINNAVTGEADFWNCEGGTNLVNIFRTGAVNYTAVATRWHVSGFLEVN